MIQAGQKAVFQQTNVALTQIRQVEIEYFSQFFTNFGTQCFLLAGFICGSISQTPAFQAECNYFWQILYNLGAAGCVAFAVQAMIGSVFISVFGQGLAIRGPLGSMVTTIEGMVQEQHNAVILFVCAVTCFVIQEIGMCWVMMDWPYAIISSAVIVIYGVYTYRSALRIYNRFYWEGGTKYKEALAEEELDDLHPEPVIPAHLEAARRGTTLSTLPTEKKEEKKKGLGIAKMFTGKKATTTEQQQEQLSAERLAHNDGVNDDMSEYSETPYVDMDTMKPIVQTAAVSSGAEALRKAGGYLTVKLKQRRFSMGRDPWERRYFVLRNHVLYYYSDKRSFDLDPAKPINTRPIDLEGYRLEANANTTQAPFLLSLVPISEDDVRKAWKFRCDTVSEFRGWIEILSVAVKDAQEHSGRVDFGRDDEEEDEEDDRKTVR
jgi:hypothetical protein